MTQKILKVIFVWFKCPHKREGTSNVSNVWHKHITFSVMLVYKSVSESLRQSSILPTAILQSEDEPTADLWTCPHSSHRNRFRKRSQEWGIVYRTLYCNLNFLIHPVKNNTFDGVLLSFNEFFWPTCIIRLLSMSAIRIYLWIGIKI